MSARAYRASILWERADRSLVTAGLCLWVIISACWAWSLIVEVLGIGSCPVY